MSLELWLNLKSPGPRRQNDFPDFGLWTLDFGPRFKYSPAVLKTFEHIEAGAGRRQ